MVGGIVLGIIETAAGTYVSTAIKDATTYLLLILIIIITNIFLIFVSNNNITTIS